MLWIITTMYIGMGEVVTTIKNVTPTVSVTTSYVIVQLLLLAGLVYTLYMTVTSTKK